MNNQNKLYLIDLRLKAYADYDFSSIFYDIFDYEDSENKSDANRYMIDGYVQHEEFATNEEIAYKQAILHFEQTIGLDIVDYELCNDIKQIK